MLGSHEIVAEPSGFFTCKDDDSSRPFGESLKHEFSPTPFVIAHCRFFFNGQLDRTQYSSRRNGPLAFFFTSVNCLISRRRGLAHVESSAVISRARPSTRR